ncbi:MAG: hypothetical protein JWO89_437 [Verrucomicrobiaceae bacterium]|nr:hypothetical protein [Verrucomicrobiaceae bacterium]
MFYCLLIIYLHQGLGAPMGRAGAAAALATLFFPSCMAMWVFADARRRQQPLPFDFGTFIYFLWPVVVPAYLFRTRGLRAFAAIGWFLLLWFTAVLCAVIPAVIEGTEG